MQDGSKSWMQWARRGEKEDGDRGTCSQEFSSSTCNARRSSNIARSSSQLIARHRHVFISSLLMSIISQLFVFSQVLSQPCLPH